MKSIGYDQSLYILPFDHRGSFETKMFGWHGDLTPAQTAEIAAAKLVIYDGFKAAIAAGVPVEKAGVLVDEQFGHAILTDARANGDARRGAGVFSVATSACTSCHKVAGQGGIVGPELTTVAKCLTPEEIVESLLWPDRLV